MPRRELARGARAAAPIFAALGDPTRLALLAKLSKSPSLSISRLSARSPLSRQAIAKHLGVLQRAGLVRDTRQGRERLFEIEEHALNKARKSLEQFGRQWEEALGRLKAFVEDTPD